MLYFFYGEECPHCHTILPLVDKLIEEGIDIEKLETWHNKENAKIFEEKDKGTCGGVPFFYNDKTGKSICGEASEEEVRAWAL
jgi:thiol-disulfide isomerase/thioredoxin